VSTYANLRFALVCLRSKSGSKAKIGYSQTRWLEAIASTTAASLIEYVLIFTSPFTLIMTFWLLISR